MLLISAFTVLSLLSSGSPPKFQSFPNKSESFSKEELRLIQESIEKVKHENNPYFKELADLVDEVCNTALNKYVLDFKSYKNSKNLKRIVTYLADLEQRLIQKESQIKSKVSSFDSISKDPYIKKIALELEVQMKKSKIKYDSRLLKRKFIKGLHDSLILRDPEVLQSTFDVLHETLQEYTKVVSFFIDRRDSYSLHNNQIFFMRNVDLFSYTNLMDEFEQSLQDKKSKNIRT